ncbi:MAG: polysaccharide biosynthesis C-terminal domain-containing protein, partial [Eubacterium sp.]
KVGNQVNVDIQAKRYIILISFGACAIMLMTPEVMKILGPEQYWVAGRLISIVILGIYFYFLSVFFTNYELYRENTKWIAIGTIAAAIVNISLNMFLIPIWGGVGAAIATFVSYFALFIFHGMIVNKIGGFNISKKSYFYGIGIVSFGFIIINITYTLPLLRWLIIVLLAVALIYWNRKTVQQIIHKIFK